MDGGQERLLQCVLLADIYYYELGPLNKDLPAILMPVGNVPILEILLHHLYVSSLKTVYILYSKANDRIKTYLYHSRFFQGQMEVSTYPCVCGLRQEQSYQTVRLRDLLDIKLVETITNNPIEQLDGFLYHHSDELDHAFLLINGPVMFNFNLRSMYDLHRRYCSATSNYLSTIAVQRVDENSLMRSVKYPFFMQRGEDNRVLSYHVCEDEAHLLNFSRCGVRSTVSTAYEPTSIYIFEKQHFAPLIVEANRSRDSSITRLLDAALQSNVDVGIHVYDIGDACACRVDCPRTYRGMNRAYLNRRFYPYTPDSNVFFKGPKRVFQQQFGQATIGRQLRLGGNLRGLSIVGDQCRVDGDVNGSILGDYVTVKAGASVSDCILGDRVQIWPECVLSDCIVLDAAVLKNGVCLPAGSIVGSAAAPLTREIVMHAIRCYAQTVWGEHIWEFLGVSKPQESSDANMSNVSSGLTGEAHSPEQAYSGAKSAATPEQREAQQKVNAFHEFLTGREPTLPNSVIQALPPIYVCKQYITKTQQDRQYAVRKIYSVPHDEEHHETYELPLDYIEVTPQKSVNEKYIEEEESNHIMQNSDECDYEDISSSSPSIVHYEEEDSQEKDQTAPPVLANMLLAYRETLVTVQHWIPPGLVQLASKGPDVSLVQRNFLKQQMRHGFHCIPQDALKHVPYLQVNTLSAPHSEQRRQRQVIYSKFSLPYYEQRADLDAVLRKPRQNEAQSSWNAIADLLRQIQADKEFQDCFMSQQRMPSRRLVLQASQNLQYLCICQQYYNNFEISLDLPRIIFYVALWGDKFPGFGPCNEIERCERASPNVTQTVRAFLALLTTAATYFSAPLVFQDNQEGVDCVISIATALLDGYVQSEAEDPLTFDKEKQHIAGQILRYFVDFGVISAADVDDWIEGQTYALEEYYSPDFAYEDPKEYEAVLYDLQLYYAIAVPYTEFQPDQ